ncbi:twitching motility protein PilT [Thermus parvatiensis]|nr:twitching motility protein PilT [Thermus parvatiensis]
MFPHIYPSPFLIGVSMHMQVNIRKGGKWLLFEANALIAQQALGRMMEALEILPLRLDDLEAIQILLLGMQGWRGTLEDASVALLALRLKAPVWTLNYRDPEALKGLSFWARVTIPWSWV